MGPYFIVIPLGAERARRHGGRWNVDVNRQNVGKSSWLLISSIIAFISTTFSSFETFIVTNISVTSQYNCLLIRQLNVFLKRSGLTPFSFDSTQSMKWYLKFQLPVDRIWPLQQMSLKRFVYSWI